MKKIILLLFILILVGCAKNEITLTSFLEGASYNGYMIEENKTGYENYDYILHIYYAVNRENAYDIQFIELKDDDYAQKMFDVNKQDIMVLKNNQTYVKSLNLSYYNLYHLENETTYYLIIRSKNNFLYIKAPIGYINEIEEFLEELDIDY